MRANTSSMIISREDAASQKLKRFFTAIACSRGHVCERLVSNGLCVECARIHKNADRAKHSDRERVRKRKYKRKTKDARRRPYSPIDPIKRLEYQRRWKEKRSPEQRKRELLKDSIRHKLNPEGRRTRDRNRSARKRAAVGRHSAADIRKLYEEQGGKCAGCFVCVSFDEKHVDHIMPLALGGGNGPDNLQILCKTCNLRKAAKHPDLWAIEIGRLI